MAAFAKALLRLVGVGQRTPPVRADEEQATTVGSVFGSSTLPPPTTAGHRAARDDDLTHFRLMLGITSAPHLGFSESALRPADNVGLYARVVHSEQTAKDNYKVFSAVINACYFLQIIVAAALTALGAANANNKAITAFGAINTVIAGFLSYLKGSGYPARFKQYAGEWKKVREYIEHRERDFSLDGCTLDMHDVVHTIREMYDNTKRSIAMNTPHDDNATPGVRMDGVDMTKAQAIAGKLRGLEDTVKKLRGHAASVPGEVEAKAEEVAGKLRGLEGTVQTVKSHVGSVSHDVEAHAGDVVARLRSLEDSLEKVKSHVGATVRDGRDAARDAARDVARDAAHEAAHSAAHVIQDEEQRAAAELRGLGKSVLRGAEDYRPQVPHGVSITLSHRDGGAPSEAVARK